MGLPDYIVADVDDLEAIKDTTLRQVAEPMQFPLSEEDKTMIDSLVRKFDSEGPTGMGLAAPQIGVSKRAFVMTIRPEVARYKKCEAFPKTVLINPSYEALSPVKEADYEQCYSVKNRVGKVLRYRKVKYSAQDKEGRPIEGVADGLFARVIQHETDHLEGRLFVDLVDSKALMTLDQYMDEMYRTGYVQNRRVG